MAKVLAAVIVVILGFFAYTTLFPAEDEARTKAPAPAASTPPALAEEPALQDLDAVVDDMKEAAPEADMAAEPAGEDTETEAPEEPGRQR